MTKLSYSDFHWTEIWESVSTPKNNPDFTFMNTELYDDGFPGNITCSELNVGQNEAINESLGGRWNRVQSCLRLHLLQHKHGNECLMLGKDFINWCHVKLGHAVCVFQRAVTCHAASRSTRHVLSFIM